MCLLIISHAASHVNGCKSQHASLKFSDLQSTEQKVRPCSHVICDETLCQSSVHVLCTVCVCVCVPYLWFVLIFLIICVFVAGELSRHVPVGVMNSRNARINFSRCQNLKSQVSSVAVQC